MSELKPMASLSASLLARKGEARPAIRRAYVPLTAVSPLSAVPEQGNVDNAPGRHDVNSDAHRSASPKGQQHRIAEAFAPSPRQKPELFPKSHKAKAAFTLRLDSDRHLRLRLASAVEGRSAQQIVTEALDAFLDSRPGLDDLMARARTMPPNGAD